MSRTKIQWATHVANFYTGCDRVSPACSDCYALKYAPRLQAQEVGRERKALAAGKPAPRRRYMNDGDPRTSGPGFAFTVHWDKLHKPPRFPAGARVFTMSMSDVFHERAPAEALRLLWLAFAAQPDVNWLVLTKRSDRMREWVPWLEHLMPAGTPWPLPNVWMGVTVENGHWGSRLDDLRATPAAVRWASCEPMLGRLDTIDLTDIGWVIGGGESGGKPYRRLVDAANVPLPAKLAWVRELRDATHAHGAAFFFKQWGGVTPTSGGRLLDGRTWDELPALAGVPVA